jgi:hypothetical protein
MRTVEEDAVGDDGVVLTDRERQALAGLAESIGDPWLAGQLVGQDKQPPGPKRRVAGSILHRLSSAAAVSGWIGLLLVLAGAALTVTSFSFSTVVASLGLVMMGVGLWRLVVDKGDVILRRLTERRVPGPEPSPPHTPPAAP